MNMRPTDAGQQLNPLLPGYSFNIYLVAGTTPIIENGPLDFVIDRQNGMSGFIINMTVKGRGKVFDGEDAIYCDPGDLLLFPPDRPLLRPCAGKPQLVSPLGLFPPARLLGQLVKVA